MKWTYLCKWILAILVVVGLSYLHLQANFIPNTDSVRAQYAQHPHLGGGLKAGAGQLAVHALLHGYARPLCHAADDLAELRVVDMRHVGEASAQLLDVRADEGVREKAHDVVGDEHEVARVKARIHAAGGVREEQYLRAKHRRVHNVGTG